MSSKPLSSSAPKEKRARTTKSSSTSDLRNAFSVALVRIVSFAFLLLIMSRRDFGTAFGKGTGKNIVRVTPVTVVVMKLNDFQYVRKNAKLRNAAWKISKVLMLPAVVERDIFPKKSRKKTKGKSSKSKAGKENTLSWSKAAEKDLIKVTKNSALKRTVGGNGFVVIGSALTVLGSILLAVDPRMSVVATLGMTTFFAGTLGLQNQQALTVTTAYFFGGALMGLLWSLAPGEISAKKKKE